MSTEHMEELNDQQIVRREKMAALREQGIDPFGKRFERTANSQELKDKFAELDKEQLHELNKTAMRTQNWQNDYFIDFNSYVNEEKINILY